MRQPSSTIIGSNRPSVNSTHTTSPLESAPISLTVITLGSCAFSSAMALSSVWSVAEPSLDAIIRRTKGDYIEENTLKFKGLKLDLNSREVTVRGEKLNLQGKQFDVLEYLLNSKNTIITKDQIFDKIWGFDSDTYTNVVEVYASGLRKELKKYGYDKYFKTIRGVGYIWDEKAK